MPSKTSMSKEKIDGKQGIVVFLDVLATKSMWKEEQALPFLNTLDGLFNKFSLLKEFSQVVESMRHFTYQYGDKPLKIENPPKIEIEVSFFSDTIIIAIYGDIPILDAFWIFLTGFFLVPLFREAFIKKIFLRGSLSIGKFYRLKSDNGVLLIGPAVNEAAQTYENANWIGISTAPSATLTLDQDNILESLANADMDVELETEKVSMNTVISPILSTFRRFPIPRKGYEEKGGWALAWPYFDYSNDPELSQDKIVEIFNEQLSAKLFQSCFIDNDVYNKVRNTFEFFESFCQNPIDLNNLSSIGKLFRDAIDTVTNERK